jgi:CheY-like chemotaxis protein
MSKRILVIDDEQEVLEIARATLRTKGYTVQTTLNAEEGLYKAERDQPDLVVVDLAMPRMSGIEFMKKLRGNPATAHLAVVVMTPIPPDDKYPESFWRQSLGCQELVVKPFDPLGLLGRCEAVLRTMDYQRARGEAKGETPAVAREDAQESNAAALLARCEPAQVVTYFVESWNDANFAVEYHCLADEMTGGIPVHDYAVRRRDVYMEEQKARRRTQSVVQVLEEAISVNMAKVIIEREDTEGFRKGRRRESYVLKKTDRGWKIVSVRLVKPEPAPAAEPAPAEPAPAGPADAAPPAEAPAKDPE